LERDRKKDVDVTGNRIPSTLRRAKGRVIGDSFHYKNPESRSSAACKKGGGMVTQPGLRVYRNSDRRRRGCCPIKVDGGAVRGRKL